MGKNDTLSERGGGAGPASPERRRLLARGAGLAALAAMPGPLPAARHGPSAERLAATTRTLEVNGRAASVFALTNARGGAGLELEREAGFHVELENALDVPTLVHWHGLTPPVAQDGMPGLSQPPIAPGDRSRYDFALARSGTHWMHSHLGLQEQNLLAAPLIVRDAEERREDRQEIVVFLHDFSFTPPEEIYAALRGGERTHIGSGFTAMLSGLVRRAMDAVGGMPMDHGGMGGRGAGGGARGHGGMGGMDLNDVAFDAFLANDRTLDDPQVVAVERGGRLRLRVINAASASNFWIDLGALEGVLRAVDGVACRPLAGRRFEIAMAQRLDIELELPRETGAFPILARREGGRELAGIVLRAGEARIGRLPTSAAESAPPVLLGLERRLAASEALAARAADRRHAIALSGSMHGYAWGIDGRVFAERRPLDVAEGERVEIAIDNRTMMSHPMHLHGHRFQVVGLGAARLAGAVRDTVIVPPMERVTIAFDADNPGEWMLHCHNLYHLAAGMGTSVRYV